MASPTISELTTRARDIFRLVVEDYLETGVPVGSKMLAARGGIGLSPASIRSVLSELEAFGLLASPHTSAGRMPTEIGLRLFVDGIMQVAEPTLAERSAIEAQLGEPGPIEQALEATSTILSALSGAAGMVMVPQRETRLAQMNLVQLDSQRALVVLVGADGNVENRLLDLAAGIPASALQEASNYINARLAGRTLAEAAR
jgi:heat-inducible transcriptional repressor